MYQEIQQCWIIICHKLSILWPLYLMKENLYTSEWTVYKLCQLWTLCILGISQLLLPHVNIWTLTISRFSHLGVWGYSFSRIIQDTFINMKHKNRLFCNTPWHVYFLSWLFILILFNILNILLFSMGKNEITFSTLRNYGIPGIEFYLNI